MRDRDDERPRRAARDEEPPRRRAAVDEEPPRRSRADAEDAPRSGGGKRFEYKRRDATTVKSRASQSSGSYDQIFKAEYPMFAPKEGNSYCVRIMPPTWDGADHYGYNLFVHSQVGADNQRYICLEKHGKEGAKCPICEDERDLKRGGTEADKKAAYTVKAKKSVIFWVIDRNDEAAGPQLWKAVWMVDRDIAQLSMDKRSNATLFIDEPEGGYDVEFNCTKKGEFSEITALAIARKPTPLCDNEKTQDKWLAYVQENPIPECLNFYDEEHIAKTSAGAKSRDEDEDSPRTRADRNVRNRNDSNRDEPEDDRPARRGSLRGDEDEPRSGRGSLRDDNPADELDEPPRRRSARAEVDEDRDEPAPPRRSKPAVADEDEPPRRRARLEPDDVDAREADADEPAEPRRRR